MRASALLLAFAVNAASAGTNHFRFVRPVLNTPQTAAQTCAVLDAGIFAHAAPGLADLRLFDGAAETPYVIRTAAPVQASQSTLDPLNLGTRNGQASFDLAMPSGTYSDLELNVSAQNFIATVTVSGSQAENAGHQTRLGAFTIFDLSAQKLGRSTVLHLPASDFRYLHLHIAGRIKPAEIESASIVRDPVAQTLYSTVAESSTVKQQGHTSIIELSVPANVPVDRVLFIPSAQPANFTRDVTVTIEPTVAAHPTDETEPPQPITLSGNLLRLHRTEDGQQIDEERLAVNTDNQVSSQPKKWVVAVANGDDRPLDLKPIRLEMQQRQVCFDATGKGAYSLYYGDSSLQAPRYDYATLFTPQKNPAQATTGPEQANPAFRPPPDNRPFTERHPALLWVALLLTMLVLGTVAVRSASSAKTP